MYKYTYVHLFVSENVSVHYNHKEVLSLLHDLRLTEMIWRAVKTKIINCIVSSIGS